MKYQKILLQQLGHLPYFDKGAICQLSEQYGLKKTTVDAYISRSLKRRELLALRNGLYVTKEFYDKNKNDISYLFYLANILRTPSYVSSWTALQYYNLATEAIYGVTSVTTRVTRDYTTKAGNFRYQSMKNGLFTDFNLQKGTFDFFIASPSKALFDMLYFKTNQFRGLSIKDIEIIIEELRIDFDEMAKSEQKKFYKTLKHFLS
ncbi:MAG: hypothetical protein Q8P68_02115 [Candidatus Peregrinibacteria bacterium]|nr:hypothetical protein [Candidatus Peregrinibacteria bacterium]